MRLLRLSEIHTSAGDRVFRHSTARAALVFVGIACIGAALVLLDWEGRRRSGYYAAYYIAGFLFLGLLLMRRFLLARLRPSNWLVRMTNEGLFIQFRSYLNYHFSAQDFTAVFIPYRDIHSAGLVRERVTIPSADGSLDQNVGVVELELAGDLGPVSQALATEMARPAPMQKTWYGTTSTLYGDYPVRLVSAPFLRIAWGVVPRAQSFLEALRPYTTIIPTVTVPRDFSSLGALSREDQEKRLRELDQRGQTIAAVYIARKLYGYGLTGAQSFVKGLRMKS